MKTLSNETQKAIFYIKNGEGSLIEKFARWQAEYTGCEYEDIRKDTMSMLSMARHIYTEVIEVVSNPSAEFNKLFESTDWLVRASNTGVDYYEVSLLGIIHYLYSLQVRKSTDEGNICYVNGFTEYIETLEAREILIKRD